MRELKHAASTPLSASVSASVSASLSAAGFRAITPAVLRTVLLLLLAAVISTASPARAQIPSEFTNLRVLPRDIEKAQLVETMRSFSFALGVRCPHCHVGEEGKPLSEFDFASDDKPAKSAARIMMEMTRSLNETQLPRLDHVRDRPRLGTRVTCATCHRGVADPRPLEDLLTAEIDLAGPEAAVKRYRELREQFYGKGTYDFGEGSLLRLTERLDDQGKSEAVRVMLELNRELFPESAATHYFLGRTYLAAGDRDRARASLGRAVELAPDNRRWREQLEKLAPPAPPPTAPE